MRAAKARAWMFSTTRLSTTRRSFTPPSSNGEGEIDPRTRRCRARDLLAVRRADLRRRHDLPRGRPRFGRETHRPPRRGDVRSAVVRARHGALSRRLLVSTYTRVGAGLWSWDPFVDLPPTARCLWLALYTSHEAKRIVPGLFHGSIRSMGEAAHLPADETLHALDAMRTSPRCDGSWTRGRASPASRCPQITRPRGARRSVR